MPDDFKVNCPNCRSRYKLPGRARGGKIDCPRCKEPLPIPGMEGEARAGKRVPVRSGAREETEGPRAAPDTLKAEKPAELASSAAPAASERARSTLHKLAFSLSGASGIGRLLLCIGAGVLLLLAGVNALRTRGVFSMGGELRKLGQQYDKRIDELEEERTARAEAMLPEIMERHHRRTAELEQSYEEKMRKLTEAEPADREKVVELRRELEANLEELRRYYKIEREEVSAEQDEKLSRLRKERSEKVGELDKQRDERAASLLSSQGFTTYLKTFCVLVIMAGLILIALSGAVAERIASLVGLVFAASLLLRMDLFLWSSLF